MIIGIDPGITGAVAILFDDRTISVLDTPTERREKSSGKHKTEYMPTAMANILRGAYNSKYTHAFIEQVSAMPGQGVTSMFGFGKGFGLWLGILAALQIPYTLVTPQRWKKEIMKDIKDKDAARGRAQQIFPLYADLFSRKKDIGRADAALIAEYGRRIQR